MSPTYTYCGGSNSANPGSYGLFQSAISSDGSWVAYDYNNPSTVGGLTGTISHIYKPFNNSPAAVTLNTASGEVTTLVWAYDSFGAPTRPASSMTQVNNVTTSSTSTAYTDSITTIPIWWPAGGYSYADPVAQAVTTVNSDGAHTLTTTTKFFEEDALDTFVASQPYSTINPDGVQQSYAYQRGDFNSSTYAFTADPANGAASSIAVITGSHNATAGTSYTSYNGFSIDPIFLVDGKSTLQVTIRDALGLVRVTQTSSWNAASVNWQLIGSFNYSYDSAGNLTLTTNTLNQATTSAQFSGQQQLTSTDASGIVENYTYDAAGRVSILAQVGGSSKNFSYDASGRRINRFVGASGTVETIATVCKYDDAGRIVSETPPTPSSASAPPGTTLAPGTISYSYSYQANGTASWCRTTSFADGGVRTDSYQPDGRLSSSTGTAIVPAFYSYSLDGTNSGFLDTQINLGTPESSRLEKEVTDWLGRTFTDAKPITVTIAGIPTVLYNTTQNNYDFSTGTGHLLSTSRTGFANILYAYDALGQVNRTGLDVDGTGIINLASQYDRVMDVNTYVTSDSGALWLRSDKLIYPTAGSQTPLTVSTVEQRLTGFAASQEAENKNDRRVRQFVRPKRDGKYIDEDSNRNYVGTR